MKLALLCFLTVGVLLLEVAANAQTAMQTPQQRVERILDEPTVAEHRDSALQDILGELGERHKLKIILTPEATIRGTGLVNPEATLTFAFRDISLRSVLYFIFDRHELHYRVNSEGHLEIVPATKELLAGRGESKPQRAARERLTKRLQQEKFRLEFRDATLNDFRSFLADEWECTIEFDVNAVFDLKVDTEYPISLVLPEMTLDQCLRAILTPFQLRAVFRHEMLLITVRDPQEKNEPSAEVARALAQKLDFQVERGSVLSITEYWSDKTKVPVVIDWPSCKAAQIDPDTLLTVDLKDVTLPDALKQLKSEVPWRAIHRDGVIIVTPVKR